MKYPFTLKSYKSKCLEGNLSVPSDKSISIRALILASYCIGKCKIFNLLESDDVLNTLEVIKKLGIKIEKKKNIISFTETEVIMKNQEPSCTLEILELGLDYWLDFCHLVI